MSGAAGNLPLPDIQARTNDEVLLLHILKCLGTLAGGGAGLATETTQLNVLSTLTDILGEQQIEFSVKCIEDANGDIYLLRIRWDEDAGGGYTYDYIDAAGNVVVPVAPLKICDPNALLNAIQVLLTGSTRTHNTVVSSGAGSVPVGSVRGSVLNIGNASGTWNGVSLPAGVSIPWGAADNNDTYNTIAYDATGTTFVIEYTT